MKTSQAATFRETVTGLDVDGMTIDNVALISTNGTIDRFDNVIFGTFAPSARQLTINHTGGSALTFTNLTFNTLPDVGFHIFVNDTNGASPFLTLQMANPNPGSGVWGVSRWRGHYLAFPLGKL